MKHFIETYGFLIVLFPLLGAAVNGLLGRRIQARFGEKAVGRLACGSVLLSFLLVAAIVFFFVVLPINRMMERSRSEPPADPTTQRCPECLSDVPIGARKCAFCASSLSS